MQTQKGGAVLWVIIVMVVVVGGFFFFKKSANNGGAFESSMPVPGTNTEEVSVETAGPKEVLVRYEVSGFSPNVVTVKKGDTIVFQNKTGKPAFVASGPHPTHTNYLEFDQYKTDQRGKDEFQFVFEKVGEWKYHDHLNASMTGTVIVTE